MALEARLVEPLGGAWPGLAAEAARLARHDIPTRYPDAQPGGVPAQRYGADDVAAAARDAETVLSAVDRAWAALRARDESEGS